MYPIKLKPATKDYIWGGDKLKKYWNKQSESNIIAESWELSCHKQGESIVDNGEYKGKSLNDLIKAYPNIVGENAKKFEFFPILIKLIDAKTNLSIQVHPSDEYALKNEGQYGKSEMWYIVDADEGAGVYCGFQKPIPKKGVEDLLNNGKIIDVLSFIEVKKGDCIYIPAGTVHAICGGILICEIQQNSSLTYRLYDYNRVDSNGNKRELHIKKSLDVIDTTFVGRVNEQVKYIDKNKKQLASCKYFTATQINVQKEEIVKMTNKSFASITVVEGEGEVELDNNIVKLNLGDTCFIPACDSNYILRGNIKVIEARV